MRFLSSVVAVLLLLVALLLTGIRAFATPPAQEQPASPAGGHAAVIAHGITPRLEGEVAWRVRPRRAALPHRSGVSTRPAGFVLAGDGVIGLVGTSGMLLARLAPGEASWAPPGMPMAVVSLNERPAGYDEIALVPAAELSGAEWELASAPFTLPEGDAFDLDLVRDVLHPGEERHIASGLSPALLLVTSGSAAIETAFGERVEVMAGEVSEIFGEAVVTGTSRMPATFVLALISAEAPATVALRDVAQPTMAPAQTPNVSQVATPASIPTPTPAPHPDPGPAANSRANDFRDGCHLLVHLSRGVSRERLRGRMRQPVRGRGVQHHR